MAGRLPLGVPRLDQEDWSQSMGRSLYEYLKSLFDSVKVLNRVPQTPEEIQAGVAASPGTTSGITTIALEDHIHAIDTSGIPGVVGTTSAQGTGTGLAVADHAHRMGIIGTKGDLLVSNGSNPVALGVGANGKVLVADSTQSSGVAWAPLVDQDARILALIGL
jgi:hypothetical protein